MKVMKKTTVSIKNYLLRRKTKNNTNRANTLLIKNLLINLLPKFISKRILNIPSKTENEEFGVLFSGSSGNPKGVSLSHENINRSNKMEYVQCNHFQKKAKCVCEFTFVS